MKNAVAVVALLLSVGGIFVSLAREEMRCYLGLADSCGIQEKTTSPKSTHEAARELERKETASPPKRQISDRQPELKPEPKAVNEIEEPKEKSHAEPTKSQPIEVIPPPEAVHESEGQPIEVIPPPEEHHQ